ncbi:MAG: hypothetical protein IKQ88_02680 [Lachnospiraceae bacterium]|nr:hypothetical protein [Lachnospiraceae bacterium]
MAGCNLKKIIRPLIPEVLINIRNERINTKEIITAAEKKTAPFSKDAFPYGIRLFGDGDSGTGIGEEVNRMLEVAKKSGISYTYIQIPEDGRGVFPNEKKCRKVIVALIFLRYNQINGRESGMRCLTALLITIIILLTGPGKLR